MNYLDIIDNFHFIRPWFLAAILPLLLVIVFLRKQVRAQSGWQGVLASHLYDNLVSTETGKHSSPPWLLLFAGWLLTCLALAGPTWEKLPQPVYQVSKGKVILMDMSMSMRAEDIKPNRLSRVRFKAMDLLGALQEGETGMVAYAGDAFVISPLTSDVQNLEALIPSLSPEIMPSQGSDAVYALETTFDLLKNAGYQEGDVFWITDGIDLSEVAPLRNLLSAHDYRINILAVGTEDGAPIKIANGNFLKDRAGAVVIPKLRTSALSTISRSTGGRFVVSRPDDADIGYLTEARIEPEATAEEQGAKDDSFGDQWKEFGPFLLLLLLPVAAYGFRRGVLPVFLVLVLADSQTQVYSQEDQPSQVSTSSDIENSSSWWNNLWQTPNQQGAKSFEDGDFTAAAGQFEDPMWQGLSHFNAGNYERAAEIYSTMDTADGNYSLGNALAQNQQYPEAIAAYERALELDPDYPNAAENKQYLEDLMEQQQQDQQQQDQNQDGEQDENEQEDSDQEQQDQNSDQQQDDSQQESDSQQQQQNSDEQQQSESEQQESEQQQSSEQEEQEGQQSEQQESEKEQDEQEMQEQQAQMQEQELTDEQKEQLQKIENWLRKVPDDPAYLLKRKMLLEQQRRQRQRLPASDQKKW